MPVIKLDLSRNKSQMYRVFVNKPFEVRMKIVRDSTLFNFTLYSKKTNENCSWTQQLTHRMPQLLSQNIMSMIENITPNFVVIDSSPCCRSCVYGEEDCNATFWLWFPYSSPQHNASIYSTHRFIKWTRCRLGYMYACTSN